MSNFTIFKFFLIFSEKDLTIRMEKKFKEIISFDTHSTANLTALANLKKNSFFFRENPSIFSKKTQFCTFWENVQIRCQSTVILLQFDNEKFPGQKMSPSGH